MVRKPTMSDQLSEHHEGHVFNVYNMNCAIKYRSGRHVEHCLHAHLLEFTLRNVGQMAFKTFKMDLDGAS